MFRIGKFMVENLTEGAVTDRHHPRFSFYTVSDRQGAYIKKAELSLGNWIAETEEQILVPYGGEPLTPFTRYTAHIAAEDDAGNHAEADVTFDTGRYETPWHAKWITDGGYVFKEKKVSPKPMTFRRLIRLDEGRKIISAKLSFTAMGIYELMLDGNKIGDRYFAPGFTDYRNNLQYQIYDVTEALKKKQSDDVYEAELVSVCAGGWAVGRFTYKSRNRIYEKRQAILGELRIEYEDDTVSIIGTDDTWEVTEDGNYREAEFYNGEIYDASVKPEDAVRRKASVCKIKNKPSLKAEIGAPVKAHETFKAVSVSRVSSGELIYDFGQNMAGVISAVIHKGKSGQRIVFRHAEVLMEGELYTEPLRTAKQEAVYICRDGEQSYTPRLTYMGFRYVGVSGIDEEDIELTAVSLYSDVGDIGSFHCSDDRLNRLQENIRWGARSNFVDIPTDCPQRDERLGWTGDIALFAPTACFNFDMRRFLDKWLKDVKTEQRKGGGIPMIVPFTRVYWQLELVFTMAVDHWGDACILVPWAMYQAYGEKAILKRMYPVMQKYIKACVFWASFFSIGRHKRIWRLLHHYGDWCAPGVNMHTWMRRGKYTATACLAHSAGIVEKVAKVLGEPMDALYYKRLKEETSEAYRKVLMNRKCRVRREFQTAYVLPLYYGMLDDKAKERTAGHLSRLVRENGYNIGTGFPGTPYILFALADNGYAEDAYRMLLNDTCPSWLYEVKTGGTTIWERWDALREDGTCNTGKNDGTGGMVSFNHYASGAVGDFLYRRVAGIEPVKGGYKRFKAAPLVWYDITSADASVETPYGKAAVSWNLQVRDDKSEADATELENSDTDDIWHIKHGHFEITVEVPVGCACELVMPDGSSEELLSGTHRREADV